MAPKDPTTLRWWQRAPRPRPADSALAAKRASRRRSGRAAIAAVPVAMVNATAFVGQFAFIRDHVPWVFPLQVLMALTFESVAVWLAYQAHVAQMSNDSSARLKLGAYAFALVMGAMNYSHYAVHWRPTFLAVGLALMSLSSPWLWGVHTRRASRDQLMERGLIEERAVRLGATRWTWHPLRSMRVYYWSTWHGVNDPRRAIARFEPLYGTVDTPVTPRQFRASSERARRHELFVPPPGMAAVPAVPEQPAPAVPATAVPALERPARVPGPHVPVHGPDGTAEAHMDPVPVITDPPVPGPAARLEASATLEANATLSGGRPSQETITNVELALAGMRLDDLPSDRAVARLLGHEQNCRRLAKRLKANRIAAGTSMAEAPASEVVRGNSPSGARRPSSDVIATPVQYQPGGNQAHG